MERNDIINFIKENGKIGCTAIEHYLDYPDEIDGDCVQIIYWEDERGLAVYVVDENGNGEFYDFDDYSHRNEIEIWIQNLKV